MFSPPTMFGELIKSEKGVGASEPIKRFYRCRDKLNGRRRFTSWTLSKREWSSLKRGISEIVRVRERQKPQKRNKGDIAMWRLPGDIPHLVPDAGPYLRCFNVAERKARPHMVTPRTASTCSTKPTVAWTENAFPTVSALPTLPLPPVSYSTIAIPLFLTKNSQTFCFSLPSCHASSCQEKKFKRRQNRLESASEFHNGGKSALRFQLIRYSISREPRKNIHYVSFPRTSKPSPGTSFLGQILLVPFQSWDEAFGNQNRKAKLPGRTSVASWCDCFAMGDRVPFRDIPPKCT
ncbi:unnamed protein product [Nesidiocoris tenuis]|uniref:Uncharacterized protein n=1 Tax=Nesidiocoris tenuis TaxID=355587 RepID=A0A6H5HAC1_9HEMI|nr:unnamed protein product [Nesidiocoris tenuis]